MITRDEKMWAQSFLTRCEEKIGRIMDDVQKDYPYTVVDGKYDKLEIFPFSWTSGFWGGIMWLLAIQTGKEAYQRRAIRCSERMQAALSQPENYNCLDNHDLGFVFSLTNVAHYRLCGDEKARIRALHAATMLAGRFNLKGRYIRAWRNGILGEDTKGYAIIDCLMNLPLLYWAAEEYGDERFALFAQAHAKTALETFLKPDGSVYHIVNFDTQTGKVKDHPCGQGYASGSSWSRGQAWGIYGFTLCYEYTKDAAFLDAARGVADYVIAHLREGELAPVDYMQPESPEMWDASATAITASGLLELSKCCAGDHEKYEAWAMKLLKALYKDADFSADTQAIVQSATELYHAQKHHYPLIYADYFLIEALMKCVGEKQFCMW